MIPQAFITAWSRSVPWPTETQVEQDLILSRLIIDIADHELLGAELAMRGGTCLHKLHLPAPVRHSEDLDYVRLTRRPICSWSVWVGTSTALPRPLRSSAVPGVAEIDLVCQPGLKVVTV